MFKPKKMLAGGAVLMALSMSLAACDSGATPTTTTAAPTNTTEAMAAPTNTEAMAAPTNTEAMAAGTATTGTGTGASSFDPSKVKKLDVEDGATLRITGWSSTPAEIQVVQDQLNRFSQVYPNVKVSYEPTAGDYVAKFKTMVSAGTEPDVFYLQPQMAPDLLDAGRLLDLSSAMQQAGMKTSDFYDQLVNLFVQGDKVYGLPKDWGSLAFFYNTDMAKSAPPANWNWDQYKQWAKDNTTGTDPNTKVFGTMHQSDEARFIPFVLQAGGKVLADDGKSSVINSKEAVQALDFYVGMIKDGIAGQAADVGASWPGEALGKKRAVGVSEGGWIVPYLDDPANAFGVKYKAAPLPVGPTGTKGDLIFTNGYAATNKTKYPKAAAALVVFLAGEENQRAVMESGFALPTLKSFKGDAYFNTHPNDAILFDALSYGQLDFYGRANADIDTALNNAITRVVKGQQDSQASLDQAKKEIDELLANQ